MVIVMLALAMGPVGLRAAPSPPALNRREEFFRIERLFVFQHEVNSSS